LYLETQEQELGLILGLQTSDKQILHFGCFPGNLQNWASNFKTLVGLGTIQGGYITVEAQKQNTNEISKFTLLNLIALMEKDMNL
jgi:hypothetical protein